MHKKFDHTAIEKKWQAKWKETDLYKTDESSGKEKVYVLDMFPYPSGEGLHVGHPKGYIATDVYSRYKKMSGYEVLHPMGWDAFGLPAENFAIKHKVHPRVAVEKNIQNFKDQLSHLGFNYDWSREINTTDPEYYKWTQWIFLKLLEKGLAYESFEPINWCPSCQTGLANEDLESDGTCERCGSVVEKRPMRQWVLRITEYADRLLEDLDTLTAWPDHIKEAQRNWIGRSKGAKIAFVLSVGESIDVFTTRPDTLFGATYMVLAPEHALVEKYKDAIANWNEVDVYRKETAQKDEQDRLNTKEKTGIKLEGITATNPANGEEIPVFIADYVLAGYGTGAIMAVPAHDERDHAFAKKYQIPIRTVISPITGVPQENPEHRKSIVAIVRNPKTNTYLTINWKAQKQTLFVGGGIHEGENPRECAIREICEESFCTNVSYVNETMPIRHSYFAHSKNVAREIDAIGFLFDLDDEIETDQKLEKDEEDLFEVIWKSAEEIEKEITDELHKTVFDLLVNQKPYTGKGFLINSGEFDGMDSEEAKEAIAKKVGGEMTSTYRLNDWVFSRQRYWGEPIPVIHCEKCGVVPVPEDQLPVTLPEVTHYEPTGTGESPLANIDEWVNTTCPKCGGAGKRETNTMPQWAGSSWYYLRFIDPSNTKALIDPQKEKDWMPVDVYVGGDHAVRHLIYARFWHKFLYDIGVVSSIEPFTRLEFLGFILAEDGRKMSKRWGNIINPDDIVKTNGADTLRVYEMFMGPFENTVAWSTNGLVGAQRFLERVNGLSSHIVGDEQQEVTSLLHKTIKKVTEDVETFKFNTAVSTLMIFINAAEKKGVSAASYEIFLKLLAPFAPHLTEELWHELGYQTSIHTEKMATYDLELAKDDIVTIAVQVNGKMRGSIAISPEAEENEAVAAAKAEENVAKWLGQSEVKKVIYVPGRILNLIVS